MSSELKLRRGSTAAHTTFTGADGEVTFDTDKNVIVSHDGATVGGFPHTKAADLAAPNGAALVTYLPSGTGAIATNVQSKLRESVSIKDFGAVGDGITDDTNAIIALNAYMLSVRGASILIPDGIYITSVSLTVVGYGVRIIGTGNAIIALKPGATERALLLGNRDFGANLDLNSYALYSDLLQGGNVISISSIAGYFIGQVVCIYSGTSARSVAGNRIPLYKQFLTIRSIDVVAKTLTFESVASIDFLVSDDARVFMAEVTQLVRSTIENISFVSSVGSSSPYTYFASYCFDVTLKNVSIRGVATSGACIFVDMLVFDGCLFEGTGGISTARGSKRVTFRDCNFNIGPEPYQNICAFIEETSENILVDNCEFQGGYFLVGNSNDQFPGSHTVIRNSRITFYGGSAIRIIGAYNNYTYAVEVIDCVLTGPGGVVDGTTRISSITIDYNNSARITGCSFVGLASTSYAIDTIGNINTATYVSDFSNNRYASSLGVHPSLNNKQLLNSQSLARTSPDTQFESTDLAYSSITVAGLRSTSGENSYASMSTLRNDTTQAAGGFVLNGYLQTRYSLVPTRISTSKSAWALAGTVSTSDLSSYMRLVYVSPAGVSLTAASWTYDGYYIPGNTTARWGSGTGSPEGVVTAAIGSLYTRVDGGLATTLYVKESGAGNTGWVAK